MPHDDTTLTMLRTDAALREREARIVELERELAQARVELQSAREALSNLLRLFAGYSVDTREVGWCTVSDADRRWIDEARAALGLAAGRDAVDRHAKD